MIELSEYKKDPVKFANQILTEADEKYSELQPRIKQNKQHYELDSEELRERRLRDKQRASLYMPEIRPATDARIANMENILFEDDQPYRIQAIDKDPFYVNRANKIQGLLDLQLRKANYPDSVHNWFVNGEICPYTVMFCAWEEYWEVIHRKVSIPVMWNGMPVKYKEVVDEFEEMTYAGPKWYSLDPEECRIDLTASYPDDMQYFAKFKDVSFNYLKAKEAEGIYGREAGGQPVGAVKERLQKRADWTNQWAAKRESMRLDRYGREYELVELWFKVYDPKWRRIRVWVLSLVGDVILRDHPAVWEGLGFPISLACSRPLPGQLHGLSTADLGHSLQVAKNVFMAQLIEGGTQAIYPFTVYAGQIYSDFSYNPRGWMKVTNPNLVKSWNTPPPVWLRDSISMVSENAKHVMNATEVMQAITRSDKEQTLGEYQGRRLTANKIMGMNFRHYVSGLTKAAESALFMSRQELPSRIALGLFDGEPAIRDLSLEELTTNVNIDMPKIKALVDEEKQFIRAQLLLATFANNMNPFTYAQPKRLYEVYRRFLLAMGEPDIESIIGEAPRDTLPPQIQTGGFGGQNQIGQGQGFAGGAVPALGGPAGVGA
jgi:hypothetical protein